MARYTGPVCRICRRHGLKLFLKGERCFGPKCAIERRNFPPGDHGQRRRKLSEYANQLKEKQKSRYIYGVLERQFRKHYATEIGRASCRERGEIAVVDVSLTKTTNTRVMRKVAR